MKIIIIKYNAEYEIKEVEKEVKFSFLQKTVDGYVEHAERKIGNGYFDLWVNEDGIGLELPLTLVTEEEVFFGNVIITKSKGEKIIGLSDTEIESIIKSLHKENIANEKNTFCFTSNEFEI